MSIVFEPSDQLGYQSTANSMLSECFEAFIVIALSISMAVIYFDVPRWTRAFGEAGLCAFLLWIVIFKKKALRRLPTFLIVMAVLYMLSYVVNSLLSSNPAWEHTNIRKYIYLFLAGLLYSYPLQEKYRRLMIVLFFLSAALAGAAGVMQYLKWGIAYPAQGFTGNPLHYAGLLAFVFSSTVILLFSHTRDIFVSRSGILFLSMVVLLTFSGILFSQARGVWIASAAAVTGTLFLIDRRKWLMFVCCMIITAAIIFGFSHHLRQRATSIITSLYTENEKGSTGTRIELWKGALLLFQESPLLGVGTGNFERKINWQIYAEGKLKRIPTIIHAHNIYLQALATRGIIGIITTLYLFIAIFLWGRKRLRCDGGLGGVMIILSTLLTTVGGLTENNVEFTKYLTAYCFTLGLLGPLGGSQKDKLRFIVSSKRRESSVQQAEGKTAPDYPS